MRSPIAIPSDSGAPRWGQWSSSITGAPLSSRHSTTLRPRRRSEIGFSPRKCEGQIGYQMFRTPLVRRELMAWVVTAVMDRSSIAETLHLFLKQLGRPARAVGRRHTRLVEAADESRQIVDAGGEGALDRIAQNILIVVRRAIAR